MDKKKIPKESGEISRREFLKDAGLVVGGAAIGSTILMAACAGETITETVTQTQTATVTVTPTAAEVAPAKFVLDFDPNKCTGCGACEYFCSTYHEGQSSPTLSRITMHRFVPDLNWSVETCRQCISPSCMSACLLGAISVDGETGARVIDEGKCTGCDLCALACPFNWDQFGDRPRGVIIKVRADTGKYFKCDLCTGRPGEPACVEACGWGALTVKEV